MVLSFKKELLPYFALGAATLALYLTAPTNGDFWNSDAPRHAMDGLFIHDLLIAHPLHGLKAWAIAYYFRHPALAILFYPPFFAAVEALFFLVFGVSHACAQAVVACFLLLLGASAYALTRAILPPAAALGCALLVMAMPETSFWGRQVMLDIPAYALAVASAACLARYLERSRVRPPMALYGAVLLLLAGIYTKYNTAIVLPPTVLAMCLARRGQAWRDGHVMVAAGVLAIGLLPAIALFFSFGRLNLQSVSGVAAAPGAATFSAWTFYLGALPGQMGWLPLLLALTGLPVLASAAVRRGGWLAAMLLGWLACGYVAFSVIALKNTRFDLIVALPLCVAAVLPLLRLRPDWLGQIACLALGVAVLLQSVALAHVPRVEGYRQIAIWLGRAAPPGAVVMYSGYRDANLVFDLMAIAHRSDVTVVRADKLLLSVRSGERDTRGVAQREVTGLQVAALLAGIGPDYVVLQPGFWGDLHDMALFEQTVRIGAYRAVAHFSLSGDLSSQDGTQGILVFSPTGPVAHRRQGLSLDMPDIGGRFEGTVR